VGEGHWPCRSRVERFPDMAATALVLPILLLVKRRNRPDSGAQSRKSSYLARDELAVLYTYATLNREELCRLMRWLSGHYAV
jgi:hypothetical protein